MNKILYYIYTEQRTTWKYYCILFFNINFNYTTIVVLIRIQIPVEYEVEVST